MNWTLGAAAVFLTLASGAAADTALLFDCSEGKGQYLHDRSGNGNNGLFGSTPGLEADDPGWTKVAPSRWALSFDGVYPCKVTVADGPSLNPTDRLAIAAHIKRSVAQPGVIVNKDWSVYCLYINMDGMLCFLYRDESNGLHNIDTKCFIPLERWLEVKVVVDAPRKAIDFHVDGKLVDTKTFVGAGFYQKNSAPLDIGFNSAQKIYPFSGMLDRLEIQIPKRGAQRL